MRAQHVDFAATTTTGTSLATLNAIRQSTGTLSVPQHCAMALYFSGHGQRWPHTIDLIGHVKNVDLRIENFKLKSFRKKTPLKPCARDARA